MPDFDVVVVGAGITGLTLARDLRERGFAVCIVEGQDRLGGRLLTRRFKGHPDVLIEAGGAHVNVQGEINMCAEIRRYGIPLYTREAQHKSARFVVNGQLRTGLPVPSDQLWALERVVQQISIDAGRINPALPMSVQRLDDLDVSVRDYFARMELPPEATDLVIGLVSGWMTADCDLASILYPLQAVAGCGGSPLDTFVGVFGTGFVNGVSELVDAIADDADVAVYTSERVLAISDADGTVTVRTDTGRTRSASACVVTAPPFTLRNMDFDPPLAHDKIETLRHEHAVRGAKKHFIVEGAPAGFLGVGGVSSQLNLLFESTELTGGRSRMIGFTGRQELAVNDLQLAQAAVAEFLPDATVIAVDGEDWYGNPLIGGIQAFGPPGMSRGFAETMSRPHGQVFFAGAEYGTTGPFWGWMEGALESSYRVSRHVTAALHARQGVALTAGSQ